jgi:hypothetical protein
MPAFGREPKSGLQMAIGRFEASSSIVLKNIAHIADRTDVPVTLKEFALGFVIIAGAPILAQDATSLSQRKALEIANVKLDFGMTTDSVLAKFALVESVQVSQNGSNAYTVKQAIAGATLTHGLLFQDGKLVGVDQNLITSSESDAVLILSMLHLALGANQKSKIEMWTDSVTNPKTGVPINVIHLQVESGELLLSSTMENGFEHASVTLRRIIGEKKALNQQPQR